MSKPQKKKKKIQAKSVGVEVLEAEKERLRGTIWFDGCRFCGVIFGF
jgi:hypothetical protein